MLEAQTQIVSIALPIPLRKSFDYLLPKGFEVNHLDKLVGCRVEVPFGKKTAIGVIVSHSKNSDFDISKLKSVIQILDSEPVISKLQMELLLWASKYYQHPLGDVLFSALPVLLRSNNEIESLSEQELTQVNLPELESFPSNASQLRKLTSLLAKSLAKEDLKANKITSSTINRFIDSGWAKWQSKSQTPLTVSNKDINEHLPLNTEQAVALSAINHNNGGCTLIDGVTGSGKTELYLQAIAPILLAQKQALVLVPEIGLTPQTVARFQQRFSVEVALWHSGMTEKQRFQTWLKAKTGVAKIIIATRSGVFLPCPDLGIIILDEEHDASFKQQDGFKYHARSLALYRAKLNDCKVLLGSATPSLESLHNAKTGKYQYCQLKHRAAGKVMPKMNLLDLNLCRSDSGLGEPLIAALQQALNNGQQAMLFINRRGFAPVIMCEECHWLTECHRCSSYTTFHKQKNRLICHHCGDQQPVFHQCQGCGSTRLKTVGVGTEQIEQTLNQLFPDTPVIRLDRDNTTKKGEFDQLVEQIHSGEPLIIVGTQMVAKGHHFANVSLVGVVDVDGALFSSDFRATEKLAQLIVQVSGRAGRGNIPGTVWLQTKFPEHPVIQDLINNQYEDIAQYTLEERKLLSLPPFSHQIVLRAEATNEHYARHWLQQVAPHLAQFEQLLTLGPAPAPMTRRAGKYRFMLTLQCLSRSYLHQVVNWLIENLDSIEKDNRIRWSIDVDPVDLS